MVKNTYKTAQHTKGYYMKHTLALLTFLISFSAMSEENLLDSSIDIHNLTTTQKNIWVNGNIHSVMGDSSLWIPCLSEEKVEIQYSEMLETLNCGETKELKD